MSESLTGPELTELAKIRYHTEAEFRRVVDEVSLLTVPHDGKEQFDEPLRQVARLSVAICLILLENVKEE